MKKKQWSNKEKFEVVLCGLRDNLSVAEICAKYSVHQSQYYKWKEQFLRDGNQIFSANKNQTREQYLEKKISSMQQVIGELTLELKKSD